DDCRWPRTFAIAATAGFRCRPIANSRMRKASWLTRRRSRMLSSPRTLKKTSASCRRTTRRSNTRFVFATCIDHSVRERELEMNMKLTTIMTLAAALVALPAAHAQKGTLDFPKQTVTNPPPPPAVYEVDPPPAPLPPGPGEPKVYVYDQKPVAARQPLVAP